jgi:hypothetical protein
MKNRKTPYRIASFVFQENRWLILLISNDFLFVKIVKQN